MAAANELIIAAILSAVATFFVAITKILQFGSRWAWSIERESRYSALIYELNGAALEPSEEDQLKIVADIYAKMKEERLRDKLLPGISDSVA